MFRPEDLIKRLKPLLGTQRADAMWRSYLVADPQERELIQYSLENLHSQAVDDYKQEKIILTPPFKFEQLHGEYIAGIVYYADKPLYPFAFQERELLQHIGVFGRTGSGKSYFVKGLLLAHLALNKPVWVFDWKSTCSDLVGHPAGVLLFIPGSDSLPFYFNPLSLDGIPAEHQKTYLRQVIELLIDSYLENLQLLTVQGVEFLLLRGVDNMLLQKETLTFFGLYEWLWKFEGKMREMDWKISALNVLYKLTTGPLGKVMHGPSWQMERLVEQKAILELMNTGSSKDKTFFIRTLLLRLYYHFQNQGSSSQLKLLVVIEEAHNVLLRKGSGSETIIELMLRQIREYGVGVCIVDQHPSLISLPALGTYCSVSFNLRLKQDRDAMASALLLKDNEAEFLGKLPPRFAIVKIQDRFMTPFLIKTLEVRKLQKPQLHAPHPYALTPSTTEADLEDEEAQEEKCSRIYGKLRQGNRTSRKQEEKKQSMEIIPMYVETGSARYAGASGHTAANPGIPQEITEAQVVKPKEGEEGLPGYSEVIRVAQGESRVVQVIRSMAKGHGKPLLWEEVFLVHICLNPLMATMERYSHLEVDKHQGHKQRNSLLKKGYIIIQSVSTSTARVKLMVPTEKGFQWLKERGFNAGNSDKQGGFQHQYWARRLREQFIKQKLSAELEVALGKNSAVDLMVSKDKKSVGVEVETGTNSYDQVTANIRKCLEHYGCAISFILDSNKAEKVRSLVKDERVAVVSTESQCIDCVIEFLNVDKKGGRGDEA